MQEHIDHWRALATASDARAAYEDARGSSGVAHRNKAESYRAVARALELERDTGQPHCPCCLKPSGLAREVH